MSEDDTDQLAYDDCIWCVGTGKIKSGLIRRIRGHGEYYECPICGGDGKHVGHFEFSRPEIYRSLDTGGERDV